MRQRKRTENALDGCLSPCYRSIRRTHVYKSPVFTRHSLRERTPPKHLVLSDVLENYSPRKYPIYRAVGGPGSRARVASNQTDFVAVHALERDEFGGEVVPVDRLLAAVADRAR